MRRNKARTILTIIAIFIGAATLTLTNGIGNGIKSYLNRQIGNLGSTSILQIQVATPSSSVSSNAPQKYDPNRKVIGSQDRGPGGRQAVMSQKDIDKIKADSNILEVLPGRVLSPDYITTPGSQKYQLTVSQSYGVNNLDLGAGKVVNNSSSVSEITLPESYLSSLGFKDDDSAINKQVTIGVSNAAGVQTEILATIVGVQRPAFIGSSSTGYANTALSDVLYNIQTEGLPQIAKDQYSFVEARFPDGLSDSQITDLKNTLKTQGYEARTIKDQVSTVFTVLNAIIIVFDMFGAIALLAASFGIVNTLLMSVQERTKEIGLMKALGMSPRKIFALFSAEAVLIGLFGSLLGIGFAEAVGAVVNSIASHGFLKDFVGLHLLSYPARVEAVIVLGIMFIAFLAGTLPAFRASRKDPIDALRYE